MWLQNTFYIFGIIFMVLNIVILISIATAVLYLKKKVDEIHRTFNQKIATVKQITTEPSAIARGVGAIATSILSFVLHKIFSRKKE